MTATVPAQWEARTRTSACVKTDTQRDRDS